METSIYVALSSQVALQRRLDTVANNVANANTSGFRAESVTFESVLSNQDVAYASAGASSYQKQSGPVVQTGNPLDLAVEGSGFLAIATPGGTGYTRDGRMRLSPGGQLETVEGYSVLDQGGSPIQISSGLGPIDISRSGVVRQNGTQIATIGLFHLPNDAKISRGPGVSFLSDKPGLAVAEFKDDGLLSGYVEGSNVNAVLEVTRLISISRTFEAVSAAVDQSDRQLSEAIRILADARK